MFRSGPIPFLSVLIRTMAFVTSPIPTPLLPNVPSAEEAELKGYDIRTWAGLVVPKGTPADIVKRLNTDIASMLADPAVRRRWKPRREAKGAAARPRTCGCSSDLKSPNGRRLSTRRKLRASTDKAPLSRGPRRRVATCLATNCRSLTCQPRVVGARAGSIAQVFRDESSLRALLLHLETTAKLLKLLEPFPTFFPNSP